MGRRVRKYVLAVEGDRVYLQKQMGGRIPFASVQEAELYVAAESGEISERRYDGRVVK